MKKIIIVLALLSLSLSFLTAAPADYSDLKEFLAHQMQIMDDCATNMDKATDADQVAAVITKFAEDLNAMIPTIKTLIAQYPEMEKMMEANPPEELKAEIDQLKVVSAKMGTSMQKVGPYAQTEVVKSALAKLTEVTTAISALEPKKEETATPETPPTTEEQK